MHQLHKMNWHVKCQRDVYVTVIKTHQYNPDKWTYLWHCSKIMTGKKQKHRKCKICTSLSCVIFSLWKSNDVGRRETASFSPGKSLAPIWNENWPFFAGSPLMMRDAAFAIFCCQELLVLVFSENCTIVHSCLQESKFFLEYMCSVSEEFYWVPDRIIRWTVAVHSP